MIHQFIYEFNNSLTFDDMLKNSFVISISDIQYTFFKKNFLQIGLKNQPNRIKGFDRKLLPSMELCKLCAISHCQIVHFAKSIFLPFVVIFEDDSIFANNVNIADLDNTMQHIPNNCSGIAFGWHRFDDEKQISGKDSILYDDKYFLTCRRPLWGANAYILFNQGYDSFLEKNIPWAIDRTFDSMDNFLITTQNFFPQKRIDFENSITHTTI